MIDEESKITEPQFSIWHVNEYATIKYMRRLMLAYSLKEVVDEMHLPERWRKKKEENESMTKVVLTLNSSLGMIC
jgi:hypothetical protein